jgi:hypothetical protein
MPERVPRSRSIGVPKCASAASPRPTRSTLQAQAQKHQVGGVTKPKPMRNARSLGIRCYALKSNYEIAISCCLLLPKSPSFSLLSAAPCPPLNGECGRSALFLVLARRRRAARAPHPQLSQLRQPLHQVGAPAQNIPVSLVPQDQAVRLEESV